MLRPAVPLSLSFIPFPLEKSIYYIITVISIAIEVALLVLNGSKDCPDLVLADDGPIQDRDKWSAITLNIALTLLSSEYLPNTYTLPPSPCLSLN